MARKSVRVNVNASVMKWARESTGIDLEEVATRFNLSPNTIKQWEEGTKKPTLTTLEKLARYYKRPLAAFFLPDPPQEPSLPTDFRALPGEDRPPLSRKTRLAIRRARRIQSLATELIEIEGGEPVASIGSISLDDDPEIVAARERSKLPISVDDQFSFRGLYEAFDTWRDSLESLSIVVYQTPIPLEEARGFSLLNHKLPIIVVSISDAIAARIFTLFHEYAHLLMGLSGICIPSQASHEDASFQETERFCNHFAGAFLVPRHSLEHDRCAQLINRESYVGDASLAELARRFKVSNQVILRRLLLCNLISRNEYRRKLTELLSERRRKKGFGLAPPKRCVLENGRFFSSLVLDATERQLITYSDLADYLSINLKHLGDVEALLHK